MSTYVMHIGRNGGAYGVREQTEDLLIWQAEDAGASSAAYLVAFLNAHARHLGAHQARRLLGAFGSTLPPVWADDERPEDPRDHDGRAS